MMVAALVCRTGSSGPEQEQVDRDTVRAQRAEVSRRSRARHTGSEGLQGQSEVAIAYTLLFVSSIFNILPEAWDDHPILMCCGLSRTDRLPWGRYEASDKAAQVQALPRTLGVVLGKVAELLSVFGPSPAS